jgi:hypothetical protein
VVKKIFILLYMALQVGFALAQKGGITVSGNVKDIRGNAVEDAFIYTADNKFFTYTDAGGNYSINIKGQQTFTLICAYATKNSRKTFTLEEGQNVRWDILFDNVFELKTHKVTPDKERVVPGKITLDPRKVERFPVLQFEQILKSVGLGVSQAGGELSSAYNVRGGNFDENLVYVNDVEIYRPFLVRSGQQEGLSFVNPDMVQNLQFSAGGWQAQYGDKLSSVLDVQYRRPVDFALRSRISLLGAELQVEDASANGRLTYMVGLRYRTNQYFLGSLDVQGDYMPRFTDVQSLISYRINKELSIEWLNNLAANRFLLAPQSQSTSFGTVRNAIRLYVGFGGQELMQYSNATQALTLKYQPSPDQEFKWINAFYYTTEKEHITVEGAYFLDQLENNLGSASFSEPKLRLGSGYFINHSRNDLYAVMGSSALVGRSSHKHGTLKYGIKAQIESIDDVLKEWRYNDSAGYRIPQNEGFTFDRYVNAANKLESFRTMAFIQNTHFLNDATGLRANYGLRANHWSINQQTVISPRLQVSFEPFKKYNDSLRNHRFNEYDSLKKNDLQIMAAFGYYYQPPFYRELRDFDGRINYNLRAQRSIHFVTGTDVNFKAWGRPFKWITEVYFKKMDDLVPYTLENVRIRYYALNSAKGYATGFDTRVNGEFIKGLESWFNLSVMSTRENIQYTDEAGIERESGFLRRPTDQRVNFSILFQDELPSNPSYKMNLNVIFGSRLPYYLSGTARYLEGNSIPPYRRVDIGFSKSIIEENSKEGKWIESLWLSLEVFNLLQVNNTISYIWIKDINNNTYGVPNYLTGRRLNFRVFMKI